MSESAGAAAPSHHRIDGIRGCVFDALGTLFDVHSAAERSRGRLSGHAEQLSALWRRRQLEYTWLRSLMGRYAGFDQVTGDALDYAMEAVGVADSELRAELLSAYLELDCHGDVQDTLARMRRAGLQTAILSNGSPAMLQALVKHGGIAHLFDAIISVEEVGVYKPDPRVYALASVRFGLAPRQLSFYSANAWDAAGAAAAGLRAVWVNRLGEPPERLGDRPEVTVSTLSEVPALLGL